MKNTIFALLFLLCNILPFEIFSQTAMATVVYMGAHIQGCLQNACATDYSCLNSNTCGTASVCTTKSFPDPVPAGSIITGVLVTYYGGSCNATAVPTSINGVLIGSAPGDGDCSPGACTGYPTSKTFPCPTGLPSYMYGGSNSLTCCPNGTFCIQRAEIIFTYTQASVAPTGITASSNPSCGGAITLTKVGGTLASGAVWKWYSGTCGGTLVGTGTSITVSPTSTTTYFVRAEGTGCGTSTCAQLTVTFNTLSVAPTSATASPSTTCGGPTTLNVVGGTLGTGAAWKWYSGSCGGTLVGTGASVTVTPTATTTYFVRAEGICNNTLCQQVTVTVNPVPFAIATPSAPTICSGATTSIALTSFTPGTTFSWTVVQTGGVTGAASGSSAAIAQILTNPGTTSGTAVYTITPTANSCPGSTINVTVTVNPIPVVTATPLNPTYCGNTRISVSLNSGVSGTAFNWTTSQTGVAGDNNGGGTHITDSLYTTGSVGGNAIYTITPSANGCTGSAISDTIKINLNPGSTATATPAISTICSGSAVSIALSSFASGTVFSWTVTQSGVSGASLGTGSTIAQTLAATGIIPGTVTYSISTTANGCTGSPITAVVTVNPVPVVTVNPTSHTFCSGNNTSINLSSTIPGTIFNWAVFPSGGVTGATPGSGSVITQTLTNTGTVSGSVVYTITPGINGCLGTPVTSTITVNPIDNASFVYSSATFCQSETDPTPTITGLAGGTFSSTPAGLVLNSNTGKITLVSSTLGTYTLTYSTSGACPANSSINVTIDNTTPFATFSYSGSPFCQNGTDPAPIFGTGASAGVFTASPLGLVFVNINTGVIDLSASTPGTYIVTNHIPPGGQCTTPVTAIDTVIIKISDNAAFVYSSATYCSTGVDPTPVVTGLSGGTFSSTPVGLSLNPSTGTIILAASAWGAYTLSYATNGSCPSIASITMTIDTITPSASFSYSAGAFCQNALNPFPHFGQNASAGIFSTSPGGLAFVSVNTGQIDLAGSVPGTYTVTNTIPASGVCSPISATYVVTIRAADDASFTYSSATYCQSGGSEIPSVTGLPGGVFSSLPPGLSINPATGIIDLAQSQTGTYTLSYTTNGTCQNTSSITMTIASSLPAAVFSYSASSFCQNGTNPYPIFNTGNSAGSFSSSPAGLIFVNVNTGEIDLGSSATGTYTITNTIPASGTCPSATATSVLIINPADNASFVYTSATYCRSGLDPMPNITGVPGGTFLATPPGLSINPATGKITLATSSLGAYTLSYTTFGTCPNTSSITMTIKDSLPSATFSYPNSPLCQTGTDPFPSFAQGASAGIFSAVPTGLVFVQLNTGQIDLSASTPGTYTVMNTIPQSGSCNGVNATSTVIINASPVVTAMPNTQAFCTGSGIATTSINLTSSIAGSIFAWTASESALTGASAGNGSFINQTLTLTGTSQGTAVYTVIATASSCAGIPKVVTVTVNRSPVADTSAVIKTVANCGTATGSISGITLTSGQTPYTYQWHDSLNNPIGNGTVNLSNAAPGKYTLTITDGNNCPIVVGPFRVVATPAIVAAFTPNPVTGQTPLTVNFTNNSIGAASYLWNFGTGDSSIAVNPSYIYTPLGTFTVCLTAKNMFNCTDSVCSEINVYINSAFIIPNVFSPNGDGINDIFGVNGVGLKTLNAEIYNRWGEKLYEWHTTNGGWDGRTASGVEADAGTYFYIIKADGIDGKKYFEKGSFTLVRKK